MPGTGDRRQLAGRLLRLRDRGGSPRGQVHDAGDPAVATAASANAPSRGGSPTRTSLPSSSVELPHRPEGFQPYARDENLARPWVAPGNAGLEHRIGGLEKDFLTGNIVSYDPANHQRMVEPARPKVDGIARDIPPTEVDGPDERRPAGGRLGQHLRRHRPGAREAPQAQGQSVAHVHLRHLNPLPADLGEILKRYRQGPGARTEPRPALALLRERYLVDACRCPRWRASPFMVAEIYDRISN